MKTLLTALRATIFGTGFILLWRWVALGLHRRYDTALGFALYIGSFIMLLGFGLFQTVDCNFALHSAVVSIGSSLCDPVRGAASPRHVWRTLRLILPPGVPLAAYPTYAFQLMVSPRLSLYCRSLVLRQDQR